MAQNVFTYVYEDSFIDQRILQLVNEIHGQCARLLCMGCHPHTRVNPAQHMIRKETQEPMWLQTIYKILFWHNKEASNTRRENEE